MNTPRARRRLGLPPPIACCIAAAIALCAQGAAAAAPGAAASDALPVSEIAPGVFVHIGAIDDWLPGNGGDVANLGFIVGSRCVAVIDSGGTPALGARLRAAVAKATSRPVCYVINSHAHPDHVLGNAAFAVPTPAGSRPQFVASARFPAALRARSPYYRNALQRDFGVALAEDGVILPDLTVERSLELDLGERRLTLQAWPTAHTDNDLTVFDAQTRTFFASDLLFSGHLPVLDGKLRGWLAALATLRGLDVTIVVPGHGAVSTDWPGALDAETAYLEALQRDTRAALKAGLTIQQAVDRIVPPAGSSWQLIDRFQRRNVTAAYAELEWED